MHSAFSVAPVPSVHLAPNCSPTTRPSTACPEAATQFHVFEYGQMPRPRSCTAHASCDASMVQLRSPTLTVPSAGRVFCFDVNWNLRALQGMTTLSDSCRAGFCTVMSMWMGPCADDGAVAIRRVADAVSSMRSSKPLWWATIVPVHT